jgi:hypothetical protein
MKSTVTCFLLVLSFTILLAQPGQINVKKRALIIAVGDYPKESGWMDISSLNDVPLIQGALVHQGFDVNNISLVTDAQATKKGILDAFEEFKSTVNRGDVVVIHYSGHGQQVEDKGRKDEVDGLDESLVPYDAQVRYKEGEYEGENHLTDDEMNDFLTDLRAKLGPEGDILVILDACHSGTGTRGLAKARGTDQIMAPESYMRSEGSETDENLGLMGLETDNDNLATMVVISGASSNELNYETDDENGNGVGSLSYAFSRAMASSGKETTYRTLFDKIRVDMLTYAPRQSPQVEGDLDMKILGGEAVPYMPYFVPAKYYDNSTIGLDAGQLAGLFEGTKVAFFDLDATDIETADTILTGVIEFSDLFSSEVYLDNPLKEKVAMSSKVIVTVPGYGSMQVKVKLDIKDNPELVEDLKKEFGEVETIVIAGDDESFDLLVELNNEFTKKTRGANWLQFSSAQDQLLFTDEVKQADSRIVAIQIKDYAMDYARANFLKEMEMQDSKMKVTCKIEPYDVKLRGSRIQSMEPISIEKFTNSSGSMVFSDSTFFKLKFKNEGRRDVYFTVINIRSNNEIDVLIPWEGSEPEDFFLESDREYESAAMFFFTEPFGNEIFKVIATKDPIDLRPLVTARSRGESSKSVSNPIEQMIQDANRGTRADIISAPVGSANIENVVFTVTE